MTTNQVASPQVSKPGHLVGADLGEVCQPDHQVEVAVPARDQRVPAEHDRLPPVRRLRELGKHDAGHASLEFDFQHGKYGLSVQSFNKISINAIICGFFSIFNMDS